MKKLVFILSAFMFVFTSCQNNLSRDKAKKQIISAFNYPSAVKYSLPKEFTKDWNTQGRGVTINLGEDELEKKTQAMESFKIANLINFEEIPQSEETSSWLLGTTIRTWTLVRVSLTDEGKKHLIEDDGSNYIVKIWEVDFDDITGIKENKQQKVATVLFNIKNKNITPFGEVFNDKNNTSLMTAYFSLFDDGWRLDK